MTITLQTTAADINVTICGQCGALVHDKKLHEQWHQYISSKGPEEKGDWSG